MEVITPTKSPISNDMFQSRDLLFDDQQEECDSTHDSSEDGNAGSQHYAFTPKRSKTLPRAWERKPATPFAPRNDAQKIWKRIPLETMNSNANSTWRKGESKIEEMRPVKRLKTTNSVVSMDKENAPYVGMKWEAELDSPKRRTIVPPVTLDRPGINTLSSFAAINFPQQPHSDNAESDQCASNTLQDMGMSEEDQEHNNGIEVKCKDEQINESRIEKNEQEIYNDNHRDNLVESAEQTTTQKQEITKYQPNELEASVEESDDVLESSAEDMPVEPEIDLSTDLDIGPVTNSPHIDMKVPIPAGLEQASIGSQNYVDAKDEVEGISFDVSVYPSSKTHVDAREPSVLTATAGLMTVENDHDDTAFLHAFLSRARAQKEAKSKQPVISETPLPNSTISQDDEIFDDIEDAPYEPTEPIFSPELEPEAESEAKASSPCRRSSRLTTRLPRPQKPTILPNNIALKRLNGTEFIAMQKETQSLALTTRANTKKNKGDAIPVSIKLIQLQSEKWCEIDHSSKKRKGRKEVSWDEKLARYQGEDDTSVQIEITTTDPSTSGQSIVQQERAEDHEEKKQARKVRKLRKVNVGTVNGTPAPKKTIPLLLSGGEVKEDTEENKPKSEKRSRTRSGQS